MIKTLSTIAGLFALTAGTAASAAPTITYNTGSGGPSFTAAFQNGAPSATFDDLFMSFTVAVGGVLNATLTTIGIHSVNDVDFTLARVNGPGGSTVPFDITKTSLSTPAGVVPKVTNPDGLEFGLISGQLIGPGTYQLQVKGSAPGANGNGSYSGTLSFAAGAVPEPTTWALMILGFGAIGFAMRRQRSRRPSAINYRVSYAG
ncbi:MAG: FxDxF family PEP-CTERM protein [Pseudomonadota bacterium]